MAYVKRIRNRRRVYKYLVRSYRDEKGVKREEYLRSLGSVVVRRDRRRPRRHSSG